MESISSYEAKTHGVPIAQLVPIEQDRQPHFREIIEELKKFRIGHTLEGLSVQEMINEGRR